MVKRTIKTPKQGVVIYQAKNGSIQLRGDVSRETLWATLDQIAAVFGRDKSVISRHLKNIYGEGELDELTTVAKNATVQMEGNRRVERVIEYYNLDAIISVGYRVNSKTATQFRQWATKVLRTHIVEGYTVNRSRIAQNYDAFLRTAQAVKAFLPKEMAVGDAAILELVSFFAETWLSLDAYDRESFKPGKATKKKVALTADTFLHDVAVLKAELMKKGEASDLFAAERTREAVEGIVGNVMQSFGGTDMYPSVEEKAAHLLYFIVKNHPFVDGNKRTGAYAFVWFLHRARVLDRERITPSALTALTLLVAESEPSEKDRLIGLITMMLGLRR